MKRLVLVFVLASFIVGIPFCVSKVNAESVAVIINNDNPISDMSAADIKKIYQDEMVKWPGGDKISIYNLPADNDTRMKFSDNVIQKPAAEVENEQANKMITNTARNPPITVKSNILVIFKVKKDKNAIGYVPLSVAEKKSKMVKILFKVD